MSEPSRPLDLRHSLRREPGLVAVVDGSEGHAVVVESGDRVAEREDLEPAGIGEDRTVPAGEGVQTAELLDDVLARPEMEVVRVAEDHVGAEAAHLVGVERLDRPLRADGHECRRADLAVGCCENAGARRAVGRLHAERHSTTMASPNE